MDDTTLNMTTTWVGWLNLAIVVLSYYFISAADKYEINKAQPALFAGTFMFITIGLYLSMNGMSLELIHKEIETLILYIAKIFFFLLVAMTYIEIMIERGVFNLIRYTLVSKGYTYKKLFWITGFLAFFISPFVDNLTISLILSTVIFTIDKKNIVFLVPGAINIVVAANAGSSWSSFGDITTLMVWISGKSHFVDFLYLFPAAISGWAVTAFLLSFSLPKGRPAFDVSIEKKPLLEDGAIGVVILGVLTIVITVVGHHFLHFPVMWGMMFGLSLLKLFAFYLKKTGKNKFCVYFNMKKIENDTLLFFFGILSIVGALHFLGFLHYIHDLYDLENTTLANISIGFISAFIDNISLMSAVLKSSETMGVDQWLLVTMSIGIGGSLISFGSVAGISVMGRLHGIYTFSAHMRHAWTILVGYIVSILVWYAQFELLGLY